MKLNKKILLCGISVVIFGLALVGAPGAANAGGGGILAGILPIELVIIDYFSCEVNFIWGCDDSGNPLSAGPSSSSDPNQVCDPNINTACGESTPVGQTCYNGCVSGKMSVDAKVNDSDGPLTVKNSDTIKVKWTVTGTPDSCNASGGWSGSKSTSGGSDSVSSSDTGDINFILTCDGAGGTVTDNVLVTRELPMRWKEVAP